MKRVDWYVVIGCALLWTFGGFMYGLLFGLGYLIGKGKF